ncbi:hypothetical protein G4D82_04920 [Flavobacterium sp. CYK-4]|uniref:toxin-antitoxin system YwqK family antitoxin n=1 Tax=Flavobacterium lotistagni TaxID=2709660 RepID=UPI00140C94FF|nr:hypothetical protein [Flavobacterium lotistagni]NHM06554.1 hypothetical protein [Flavobacterium lotistagni]
MKESIQNKKSKIILGVFSIVLLLLAVCYFIQRKDETIHTIKRYDRSSNETYVMQYIIKDNDTIVHGTSVSYDKKGNKIVEGQFVNNKPFGKWVYYFNNGNIKAIHYRLNKKSNAESIWNYSNGKIERYVLYDEFEKPVFIIRYDEAGNVKSYEGLPLIEIYQFKIARKEKFKINIDQYLKVGDTLKYQYLLANLPNSKRNFKIERIGCSNLYIKRILTNNPPSIITVKEVVNKKGINTIRAVVQYKFSDIEKTVINDTISFDIEVH